MRSFPRGFGGQRRDADDVKRVMRNACLRHDGWREQGVLAVALDDPRLSWPEKELVRQLGEKLYGRPSGKEAHHG